MSRSFIYLCIFDVREDITGRKKEMIIRGGENIYPKQVEEVLYQHPSVLECAVVGVPDKISNSRYLSSLYYLQITSFPFTSNQIWGEQVCAVISLKEAQTPSTEEIISYPVSNFRCALLSLPSRFPHFSITSRFC